MAKRTNGKQKKEKASNGAKRKPDLKAAEARTIESLTDDQRQSLLFSHKRKLRELIATEKVAKDAIKSAFKIAEAEGVGKKEILLALAIETDEGEAKARADAERIIRVSRWMGQPIGAQADMFGGAKPGRPHFEAGKRAAMDDQMRKPPTHLHNGDANEWFEGYDAGREARNLTLAANFKPLGDGAAAADSLAH